MRSAPTKSRSGFTAGKPSSGISVSIVCLRKGSLFSSHSGTILLVYKRIAFTKKMAEDRGSGAEIDLSSWSPTLEEGWYYLGESPSIVHRYTTAPTSIVVCPMQPDAVRPIVTWERVWNYRNYALWRGVAPGENYIVVGGIFTNSGNSPPDGHQKDRIVALRRDLVVMDDVTLLWTNAGSQATADGSVWKAIGMGGNIEPNVLIPTLGHNAPPRDQSICLNKDKVFEEAAMFPFAG
ncbi:hypothetical protein B0H14DRAFT_2395548 [Mycena olivaceomarginata]|nr:hypothetical protein B0H14DRAFT_2395548 [Mycena olivaceomarginata]